MASLLSLVFSLLMFGLLLHWILGFIQTNQFSRQFPQISKIKDSLGRLYDPILYEIKNRIRPIITMKNGNEIDFSPAILLIALAIMRKLCFVIF